MTDLEKKRMNLELMRVTTARMDLELKVDEMKEEIKRLLGHIDIQIKKEQELQEKLGK